MFRSIPMAWLFTASLVTSSLCCANGGRQLPHATVSDPAIFTMLHVSAATAAYANADKGGSDRTPTTQPSVRADLERYFRTRPSEYKDVQLRMDEMLDGRQRVSSLAQLFALSATVRGRLDLIKGAASQPAQLPAATQFATTLPVLTASELDKLEHALSGVVTDSPFDALDRARDFYTAYLLKVLTQFGRDSRVILANDDKLLDVTTTGRWTEYTAEGARLRGRSEALRQLAEKNLRELAQDINDYFATALQARTEVARIGDELAKGRSQDRFATTTFAQQDLEGVLKATQSDVAAVQSNLEDASADSQLIVQLAVAEHALSETSAEISRLEEHLDSLRAGAAIPEPDQGSATNPTSTPASAPAVEPRALVLTDTTELRKRRKNLKAASIRLKDAGAEGRLHIQALDEFREIARTRTATGASRSLREVINASVKDAQTGRETPELNAVQRLLLVLVQVHVSPGTRPNMMTGVRMRIVGAAKNVNGNLEESADLLSQVKIISVHPTRNYDIDDETFIEKTEETLAMAMEASGLANRASGRVDRQASQRREERRRFLSRIAKTASFVDAGTKELGWNFYPSNLLLTERSLISQFADNLLFQPAKRYEVRAFLEGGARDCAFYLVVPKELERLRFQCDHVVASIDLDLLGLDRGRRLLVSDDGSTRESVGATGANSFTLDVPAFDPAETYASFDFLPLFAASRRAESDHKTGGE